MFNTVRERALLVRLTWKNRRREVESGTWKKSVRAIQERCWEMGKGIQMNGIRKSLV